MLNDVLTFLKIQLNQYLSVGAGSLDPGKEPVVFPNGRIGDALSIELGAVSLLLVRLEEEKILRPPNLHQRTLPDGSSRDVPPEIRLDLYLLTIAHYQQYDDAWRMLSKVLQFFQQNRLITRQQAPNLAPSIEQLVIELVTQSFAEQNEVWSALRLPYHPSLLYKVKTVLYQGDLAVAHPMVDQVAIRIES